MPNKPNGEIVKHKKLEGWHITLWDGFVAYRYSLPKASRKHSIATMFAVIERETRKAPKCHDNF